MKYSPNKSFGYPVINPYGDDFNDDKFNTEIDLKLLEEKLIVTIENKVPDFIKRLANEKKIKFFTVLRCPFTAYEEHKEYYESNKTLEFSSTNCCSKIEIDTYIICNEVLTIGREISKNNVNKFYEDLDSPYEKNSILGFSKPESYPLTDAMNNLRVSIFDFQPRDDVQKGCFEYDFSGKQIVINCHNDEQEIYRWFQTNTTNKEFYYSLLLSTVLVPALSTAILAYKNDPTGVGEWKDTVISELKEQGRSIEDPETIDEVYINLLSNLVLFPNDEKSITKLIKNTQKFEEYFND